MENRKEQKKKNKRTAGASELPPAVNAETYSDTKSLNLNQNHNTQKVSMGPNTKR